MILLREASPTIEFYLEPSLASKDPTPEILSRIQVSFMGQRPMPIARFLYIAKNPSCAYQLEASSILTEIKKLAAKKRFKGTLLEFIFIYFVGNDDHKPNILDVFVRSGTQQSIPDERGHIHRTSDPVPVVSLDKYEIDRAEDALAGSSRTRRTDAETFLGLA